VQGNAWQGGGRALVKSSKHRSPGRSSRKQTGPVAAEPHMGLTWVERILEKCPIPDPCTVEKHELA
jgi:hypothetical protein